VIVGRTASRYLAGMARLPTWIPRNPGCGCLLLLFLAVAAALLLFDGH
jgi:hypothetical protein